MAVAEAILITRAPGVRCRYSPSRGTPETESREWSAAFKASYSYLLGECSRLVVTDCVRKIDPDRIAAQLWSALHGFIMLELDGYFAASADSAAEVLVPMCANLGVGLGADRKRAESSAATATAGWANSLGVRSASQRSRKARR